MIKHFVYVIVHEETGELVWNVAYDDESKAQTVRLHILPTTTLREPLRPTLTRVLEMEVVK